MRIGLMAYHSACNFGATLQLLSTYMHLVKRGYEPIVINWIAQDLDEQYAHAPQSQRDGQAALRKRLWRETALCRTSEDVAKAITAEGIEGVIIGADAVCQHHTRRERIIFPCKRIVAVEKATSDRLFPNPFWADWNDLLPQRVPVCVLSASSQDSEYHYFSASLCSEMAERIRGYAFASVRDTWTRDMFSYVTNGEIVPEVTPDPVFAFDENASHLLPTKQELMEKFGLPERYIVMTFMGNAGVSEGWMKAFEALARKDGIACVQTPFSQSEGIGGLERQIHLPLTPLEWFALIKNSCGYVGNNMHPIVVSIHTGVPFYSFDNYGLRRFNGLYTTDKSSKIKHILSLAGLEDCRTSCISRSFKAPSPEVIYEKVRNFDREKSRKFAEDYLAKYQRMMDSIMEALTQKRGKA